MGRPLGDSGSASSQADFSAGHADSDGADVAVESLGDVDDQVAASRGVKSVQVVGRDGGALLIQRIAVEDVRRHVRLEVQLRDELVGNQGAALVGWQGASRAPNREMN